jgi:hypothetical protein
MRVVRQLSHASGRIARRVLPLAAALAAVGLPWYLAAKTLADSAPVNSHLAASSVIWADRVFVSQHALAAWLHSRGVGYTVWASRHPFASARIKKS